MHDRDGRKVPTDASSGVKVLTSSWRLKPTPDSGRPPTSVFAMGTSLQDHADVAGSGDLAECKRPTGVTPEFPGGTYHDVVTDTWPDVHRCFKGTAMGGGGGGGPGGGGVPPPPAGG